MEDKTDDEYIISLSNLFSGITFSCHIHGHDDQPSSKKISSSNVLESKDIHSNEKFVEASLVQCQYGLQMVFKL